MHKAIKVHSYKTKQVICMADFEIKTGKYRICLVRISSFKKKMIY